MSCETLDNNICDVCGKEFQEEKDIFECDEGLCPYNAGSIDPYAPLDFTRDCSKSLYLPDYMPDLDDQEE